MNKRVCIITGANSGIGKEAAAQIADKGYHVIMACRNNERGAAALQSLKEKNPSSSLELKIVDMGSRKSIIEFADQIKAEYSSVDCLIHNAAIFDITQKKAIKNKDGIEAIWAVNHLGPVLLTELLLDNLKKSSDGRIITISSQGLVAMPFLKVNMEDPEFDRGGFSVTKAYYQSKLAQVMYTYHLSEELKESGISVNSIRVTAVRIDLSRHPELSAFSKWVYSIKSKMALTPAEMAETYTWLATSPEASGVTGKYFNEKNREVSSSKYTRNEENIKAMMELTRKYLS